MDKHDLELSQVFSLPVKKRRRVFLGDFEMKHEIARGSMGKVYLAYQKALDRKVAVKFLDRELSKDPTTVERFVQEAKAAAAIQHSNVVSIVGRGDVKGRPYFVMEYLEGGSLADKVIDCPLKPDEAIDYLRQAAQGLQAANEHSLIHRDVKPRNLMLSKEGTLKVTDFGLAKRMRPQSGDAVTTADVIVGTPHYMSPEQAQGKHVDCRSDMYSLGVTFFHLLTNEVPFDDETPMGILVKHLENPIPSLKEKLPGIPTALCGTVERLMQKKPEDRFQSYDELIEHLSHLSSGYDSRKVITEMRLKEAPPEDTATTGPSLFKKMLPILVLVLLVAAFLLLR